MPQTLNQRDYISVPVSSGPVQLSSLLPTTSHWRHALIGISGGAVRWSAIKGQAPSSSAGVYVGAGGQIDWSNPEVDYSGLIYNAQFIKAGANDASLEVALFW